MLNDMERICLGVYSDTKQKISIIDYQNMVQNNRKVIFYSSILIFV